jgi:hypothetical protein
MGGKGAPTYWQPIGEKELALGVVAMAVSDKCTVVSITKYTLVVRVVVALDAQIAAANGRLKRIRQCAKRAPGL